MFLFFPVRGVLGVGVFVVVVSPKKKKDFGTCSVSHFISDLKHTIGPRMTFTTKKKLKKKHTKANQTRAIFQMSPKENENTQAATSFLVGEMTTITKKKILVLFFFKSGNR